MGHKAKKTLEKEAAAAEKRENKLQTAKQIRARARRAGKVMDTEFRKLYKPLDEWDEEELARGRPRAVDGTFKGHKPEWISREIHEETVRRFQAVVRGEMNAHTVEALRLVGRVLDNDETDHNDRPVVPAGVKLDAAKFLIEHVIGKPTQRTETDISVRLQGILGVAMVASDTVPMMQIEEGPSIIDIEDDDEPKESDG